ncbi:MAG: class I SAM-dependent methyltransferase [Clostridia bacterium]|nr:class I SAM-dependent methyltransferase [Clostridia bacterium]
MNTRDFLNNYYTAKNEDERLLSRHGSVEFITTVHYIEKYLKDGMNILELGAGSGRYSHYFARKGYKVDAVELIERNIELFRENTVACENVRVTKGDARDLSSFPSESYDITLILGPMYHLYTDEDKLAVLSEALRVTKQGGIVFCAYCMNEACVVQFCFMGGHIKEYLHKLTGDFKCISEPSDIFEMYRREDIDRLMSNFNVERLHFVGTDMATGYIKDKVNAMDDETFDLYLRYHLTVCERCDLVGASNHTLDIFRKGEI